MVDKMKAEAYDRARRNAENSKMRLDYAKKLPDRFTKEDMEQLEKEMLEDEQELCDIRKQLKAGIAGISNVLTRRIAEDHYLRGITTRELAERYHYSKSTIRDHLRMSRCPE